MHDRLIIIGAGGHGSVLAETAQLVGLWENISFLDDQPDRVHTSQLPILGSTGDAHLYKKNADFIVAIGDNSQRKSILSNLIVSEYSIATLIHPRSVVSSNTTIGRGSVVMAGSVISTNCTIGNGCIINTSASVDHDTTLANYVHVSPGVNLGGDVTVEESVWLGIGSTVINGISIIRGSVIGAGAVVIKDVVTSGTYVGIPARRLGDGS